MATIIQSIGSVGRDFPTLTAWASALPLNLVTDGNSYIGQCYNDSEFLNDICPLTGFTTDATHTITLTTGPGQSFRDNVNVRTNSLSYNVSNGVGIRRTSGAIDSITTGSGNISISNLQVRNEGTSAGATMLLGDGSRVDFCLLECNNNSTIMYSGSGGSSSIVTNSLFRHTGGDNSFVSAVQCNSGFITLYFCTLVASSDVSSPAKAIIHFNSDTVTMQNCAVFGFVLVESGTGTGVYTNCMTDVISPPSGFAGSRNYLAQFVNGADLAGDFREKTGADLRGAGTPNSTYGLFDISGLSRPQSGNWDIGAWELLSSGASTMMGQMLTP